MRRPHNAFAFPTPIAVVVCLCLLIPACALFESMETPYFGMSYYRLSYADTNAVVEAERGRGAMPRPQPLTLTAWRAHLLDTVQAARNGGIHPSEIPASLLSRVGVDATRYPDFGKPTCKMKADISASDFEVPGDDTDLGGVAMNLALQSTDNCSLASSQRPDRIDLSGPQHWTNGDTLTVPFFEVRVDGVPWTTRNLANKVTVTYKKADKRGAGALWFVAADQSTGSGWVNQFEAVLIAPSAGFVLDE